MSDERSRRDLSKAVIEAAGLMVKHLILTEAREKLRPFPEMRVARAGKKSSRRYDRSRKIKGLLVVALDRSNYSGEKYYILTPKGIFCHDGFLNDAYGPDNPLPCADEHRVHELMLSGYIRFSGVAFGAIAKELERRQVSSTSS